MPFPDVRDYRFCPVGTLPGGTVSWATFDAIIPDTRPGATQPVFSQPDVRFPVSYSQNAVNVVASKYFYGVGASREASMLSLVNRIATALANAGAASGQFDDNEQRHFKDDFIWLYLHQYYAMNSPVQFNVGLDQYGVVGSNSGYYWQAAHGPVKVATGDAYKHPQGSACFIQSVADTMESIGQRGINEQMIFKYGSGSGTDNSPIRSSYETIGSSNGHPSGPVSFMQIYDAIAAVTKSGGKVRRAAKMESLKIGHPDILKFIRLKSEQEATAHMLIAAGMDPNFNDGAYSKVGFQNANLSVRVTDAFMRKAIGKDDDPAWQTIAVTTGTPFNKSDVRMPVFQAPALLDEIADAVWFCGDPGLQYEDTIQHWHTCPNTAPINASNPCCFTSETLVRTSEGSIPIGRLAEMDRLGLQLPLAFAFDSETRLPVLRQIRKAWKAGETRDLVEVKTDKGLGFRSTPEHRYYLRDGRQVEAKDLRRGDRLRKVGRSRIGKAPRTSIENREGTFYQSRWMWEQVNGSIPDGYEIHHKNDDRRDDRLSNFEIKEKDLHRRDHSAGLSNSNSIECPESLLVETWEAIEAIPRKTHLSASPVSPGRWNQYVRDNQLNGKVPLVGSPTNGGRIRGMNWAEFAEWIEGQRSLVNDLVTSVDPIHLDTPVEVFDIEVDGVHNFAITNPGYSHDIIVSNSEYMFIDDSACNLASLNLMKFKQDNGDIDIDALRAASHLSINAQEALVDLSSYPTEAICQNSHDFRPLGLGYANLGALLMSYGLPYDSKPARAVAACLTAIIHGQAYLSSAWLAARLGPFPGYAVNREPMMRVIKLHADAVERLHSEDMPPALEYLHAEAKLIWGEVLTVGGKHGFRNSQVTVLAPTGTIAFMMDCDTTGIEPDLALVKYKHLAGGGIMKIVNQTVPAALETLGYDPAERSAIIAYINANDTIEGCVTLAPVHLPVFDCALAPPQGGRSIAPEGHIAMMAAVQPFLSGAISKTVNAPPESTPAYMRKLYLDGWISGLKALAIYRDGCKKSQPLNTTSDVKTTAEVAELKSELTRLAAELAKGTPQPVRRRLDKTRKAINHRFDIQGHRGYLSVGLYPEGTPAELFITMAKEGSTIGGLMDAIGGLTSLLLQHGVSLEVLVNKFSHVRFEPSGFTKDADVPIAKSVVDYVFRWLGVQFVAGYRESTAPQREIEELSASLGAVPVPSASATASNANNAIAASLQSDAPACDNCGAITIRCGTCYRCNNCGNSLGCS